MTAEEVRQAMAAEPAFLELATFLREHFDAKLAWFKTADIEIGKRPAYLPAEKVSA